MSVHPKVATAGIAGAATTIVIAVARAAGFDVSPDVAAAVAAVLSFLGGYLKAA